MDEYRIDTKELWYYILYPICLVIIGLIAWGLERLIVHFIQYFVPSIKINNSIIVHGVSTGILFGIIIGIIFVILEAIKHPNVNLLIYILTNINSYYILGSIALAFAILFTVVNLNRFLYPSYKSTKLYYEPINEAFANKSDIDQTIKNVQQSTQSLQKSLDTLSSATDDTCSVMKGIEKRFLDNVTAPDGDGEVSPAEAKEIKAKKLPAAQKQWNQKKQDWSDTHGQISMVECFTDGSLSELVAANQQLSDLLASAPVQRVVAQVKSLQVSSSFAQSYIDQLVAKLTGESFINPTPDPTPEDTVATSNKLMAQAKDVQASINRILDSTNVLKTNYAKLDAKANDPNTVNNLAGTKV